MLPILFAALLALQIPAQARPVRSPERPWTILVYGGADNNADGPILFFLDSVRKAIDDDAGIELLLLIDRSEKFSDDAELLGEDFTGARLYRLKKDSAERLAGGKQFPELTLGADAELDSADADNVRRFLAWGKEHYPAQHYGLMIYSHANGETMCPDEESGRDMGIPELTAVATQAESVDFLALELCNMGGIEIGYQWRPDSGRFGADVLLAIPNAGPPLDWERAFARIRSKGHGSSASEPFLDPAQMSALDFGKLVIEEGLRGRLAAKAEGRPAEHESAGCYDLRKAKDVKLVLDRLSVELWHSQAKDVFLEMRGPGPIGDAINYTAGGPYVDLYDLCRRASECDALTEAARKAAGEVMHAVDEFMVASFGMEAYAGFEGGKNGVFVVLPRPEPGRWKQFGWYSPLPGQEKNVYGRWSFLADGATPANGKVENWFELLDCWYDQADDGGGSNGYRW